MKRRPVIALGVAVVCGLALAAAVPAQAAPQAAARDPREVAAARASEAIRAHPGAVQASPDDTYQVWRVVLDPNGAAHVRYERSYRGLPVVGGDLVVHLDPDGRFVGAATSLDEPIALDVTPRVDAAGAARAIQTGRDAVLTESPGLVVDAAGGRATLAWRAHATVGRAGETAYVDGVEGRLTRSVSDYEESGTGNSEFSGTVPVETTFGGGHYNLVDATRGNATTCDLGHAWSGPCPTFTDADNVWGDGTPAHNQTAGVDAHYGAANTYDYYNTVLGRAGVFGDGTGVTSHVHTGTNWDNAHWDKVAKLMEYGDGYDGQHPLAELDVVGHEMTHGVTQATANLNYFGDAGGLNESTSDIFGTMAEFYAANPADPGDYLIGEKIDIFGTGDPLRYMYQPSLDGISVDCWSPSVAGLNPHYSSGVGNHFYFLLAQGSGITPYGTSPTCDGSAVTGLGRTKAARIWYRALNAYFTSGETYPEAAGHTVTAAQDLYGACSTEAFAVAAAWTAVGIPTVNAICFKLDRYYVFMCKCIWPCPDPGPLRWAVDIPEWGQLTTVEVGVDITHARPGDLQIDLLGPAGQAFRLKNAGREQSGPDVNDVFKVRLDKGLQPGTWTLVVTDTVKGVQGQINGWSILA